MSLAPLIEFHVTSQSQSSAQLEFIVNAASASGATALVFALATSDPIGAAMKPAAQSRVIGARLSIDSAGDGSLVPVKGFERGDTIRISGTLGDFGARELTFSATAKTSRHSSRAHFANSAACRCRSFEAYAATAQRRRCSTGTSDPRHSSRIHRSQQSRVRTPR
jgi:hypothetical protein